MTKKAYLMVRNADHAVLGCMWQDDGDVGPTIPQALPPEGVTLVDTPGAAEFSREGHADTESAYLVERALIWRETASLVEIKARKWEEIKAARAGAEVGSFTYDGGAYQVNVAQVTGAVTMAMLARAAARPYSIVWTLTDNSRRTLDGDQMIALGVVMGNYVDGIYATARALRDQIDAAATIEAVEAIAWPA